MTRDDIIRMAKEAGVWPQYGDPLPPSAVFRERQEKFAQLVAAHEREECAKLSDMLGEMLAKDHPVHAKVALTIGIKIRTRT